MFSFNLITFMLDIVWILYGEILSRSLKEIKRLRISNYPCCLLLTVSLVLLKQSFLEYLASNESTSREIDSHLSNFGQKEE